MEKLKNPSYADCVALIREDRGATYIAEFDPALYGIDRFVTLTGSQMLGFLILEDRPVSFWRFA